MKKLIVLFLAMIMTMSLVACGGGSSDEGSAAASDSYIDQIKAKGELVVGTSADYPPYEFHTEIDGVDTIVGFDIDIAQAIADELGYSSVEHFSSAFKKYYGTSASRYRFNFGNTIIDNATK